MQMVLDCGSWPWTIFFPKVKLLSSVEVASSSILMGLNPWFLYSNGRIYHSISILNWLLPMWKKDIGRKAYWLLAKLEKRYMRIFLCLLPDHLPLHPRLLQCLICSLFWNGDSHGSLSLARGRLSEAGAENVRCSSPTSSSLSTTFLAVAELSSQLQLPTLSPSFIAPALTNYSISFSITPCPWPHLFRPRGNGTSPQWPSLGVPASLLLLLNCQHLWVLPSRKSPH